MNHGNDTVCDEFAATVHERLGLAAEAPYNGAVYTIEAGRCTCLEPGNRQRIGRGATPGARATDSVFRRLQAAGRRLLAVIDKNRGGANKELARFADQINDLCNKWDR